MPTRRETDHLGAHNFLVEIDGIEAGQFQAVRGLSGEIDVVEFRDGSDPAGHVRKRPGASRFGDVTLEKGFVPAHDLLEWWEQTRQGAAHRRAVSVVLLDSTRTEVRRWNLFECWPRRWELSPLRGDASQTLFESITLVVERIEVA